MYKRKSLYVILLLMIAVAVCGSLALGTTLTPSVISKGLNASVNDGIMPFGIIAADPSKDLFINCYKHEGDIRPYVTEKPWNGRIEVKLHLGGDTYIYVNLDTRDQAGIIKDDMLVEFRCYYKNGNSEVNKALKSFSAYIQFYSNTGELEEASCTSTYKATGGFTRSTTFTKNSRAHIWLTVDTTEGISRTAEFEFTN